MRIFPLQTISFLIHMRRNLSHQVTAEINKGKPYTATKVTSLCDVEKLRTI